MKKTTTDCCALCQISGVGDKTPINDLRLKLAQLKQEMEDNKEVGFTNGNGQTAVFVIVSPGETLLRSNLVELGFTNKHMFERRRGYPDGKLTMFIKNL